MDGESVDCHRQMLRVDLSEALAARVVSGRSGKGGVSRRVNRSRDDLQKHVTTNSCRHQKGPNFRCSSKQFASIDEYDKTFSGNYSQPRNLAANAIYARSVSKMSSQSPTKPK